MHLTNSLRLLFWLFVVLHLASASAAIVLLGRMKPAIEHIGKENVTSLQAVEAMLAGLATGSTDAEQAAQFRAALAQASSNITDPRERPILGRIGVNADAALAGEVEGRRMVVQDLRNLGEVNRDNIDAADVRAQQLGTAVFFLAVLTLLTALGSLRRADRRVLAPLEELHTVLRDLRTGNSHRRCAVDRDAAAELSEAMAALNRVLDDHDEALRTVIAAEQLVLTGGDDADRATMLQLLDEDPRAVVVVDDEGVIVAANPPGFDALSADLGLRDTLRRVVRGEQGAEDLHVRPVKGASRMILALSSHPGTPLGDREGLAESGRGQG
jgi:HAMP domain-containing protein